MPLYRQNIQALWQTPLEHPPEPRLIHQRHRELFLKKAPLALYERKLFAGPTPQQIGIFGKISLKKSKMKRFPKTLGKKILLSGRGRKTPRQRKKFSGLWKNAFQVPDKAVLFF